MNTLQPDFNQTFRVPIKRLARPDKITMTVKDFNPGLSVMGVSLGRTEADQEVGVCEIPAEKIVALEQADGGLQLALPLKMVTGKPGTRRSDFPSAPASSASPAMIEVRIRILGTIKAKDSGADTDVGQGQAPMAGNKGLARDAAETALETLDTEALPLHAVDVVQLIETVEALVVAATNRERPSKLIERTRHKARMLFRSLPFQMFVALLILANFFANAYEAQMNGRLVTDDGLPSRTAKVLKTADLFFTIIFTVELLINMYAHLFWAFVRDGWCMFDFFVVTVSLISTFNDDGD
ncbi:MAG: ion transporter, partial [Promethearchaeia archaeon]